MKVDAALGTGAEIIDLLREMRDEKGGSLS